MRKIGAGTGVLGANGDSTGKSRSLTGNRMRKARGAGEKAKVPKAPRAMKIQNTIGSVGPETIRVRDLSHGAQHRSMNSNR